MKKLIAMIFFLAVCGSLSAFDFEIGKHQYTILSKEEKTVEMTKFTTPKVENIHDTIPATISNDGTTYTVTTIGKNAYYFSYLKEITIPGTIRTIREDAFNGCSKLTKVNITDLAVWCETDFGNEHSVPTAYSHNLYLNGSELNELIVPEGVKSISNGAFYGCHSLRKVKMASTVEYIGVLAFRSCFYINTLDLSNVQSIDERAFLWCNGIKTLNIPKTMKSLGKETFAETDFTTITVDSENPYFDSRDQCNGIVITASNTLYLGCSTTVIPCTVEAVGDYAYEGCTSLKSLYIPQNVKFIGLNAIHNCSYLTTMTMPALREFKYLGGIALENLNIMCKDQDDFMSFITTFIPYYGMGPTHYPDWHFYIDGKLLTNLTLPSDIQQVYQIDFSMCPDIENVTCYATVPPKAVARWSDKIKATLFVPEGTIDAYKSTAPWSQFSYIGVAYSGINDIKSDSSSFDTPAYDISGRRANDSTHGIVIKEGKKILRKL